MFRRFIKGLKRTLRFLLILGAIFLLVATIINLRDFFRKGEKISVIIDSGTGRETGNVYAIVRAITGSDIEVRCLSSSQWNSHPDAPVNPIEISHQIHETILDLFNRNDIPALKGTGEPFNLRKVENKALSEASRYYISQVRELRKKEKLNIVFLGAMTNLAWAISAEPSIAERIRVYCIAMKYDSSFKVWNKNETNVRYDLDAVDFLLNTPDLEMYILPADLTENFTFTRVEIAELLEGKGEAWNFMADQWKKPLHEYPSLIMPEVALIEALANPKYVKILQINAPPENYRRKVNIFRYINKGMMKSSFINSIRKEIRTR